MLKKNIKRLLYFVLAGDVILSSPVSAFADSFSPDRLAQDILSSNTYNILKGNDNIFNPNVASLDEQSDKYRLICANLVYGDDEELHFGGPIDSSVYLQTQKNPDYEITLTSMTATDDYTDQYTAIPKYIEASDVVNKEFFDNYITRIKNADTIENDILSLPSSIKEASFNEIHNKYIICGKQKMSVFSAHYIDPDRFVNIVSDSDSDVYRYCRYQGIPVSDGSSPQLSDTSMTLTVGSSAYIQMLNTTNANIDFSASDGKIKLTPYSGSRLAKGVYVQALRPGTSTVTCDYLGKKISCVITILPADKSSALKSLESFYSLSNLTSDQKNALAQKLYFDCMYQDHPDYDVYPYMTYFNGVDKSVIKSISPLVYKNINKKKNAVSLGKQIDEFRKYSAPYGEPVNYAMVKNGELYTQKKGLGCINLAQNTDLFNDPRSTAYLKPQY